tara:strand:+ start:779 stop:1045 length:267 start_codon:yes stop_codon:yes gene_type:complete
MKQIKKLTVNNATNYIYYYKGEPKHKIYNLVLACRKTAKKYDCTPLEMFFFMVDNRPIKKLYTHSYTFHTRTGRQIRKIFANNYFSSL